MRPVTRHIAQFSVDMRLQDISDAALDTVRTIVLDTVGVTVAGSRTEAGRIVADYAGSTGQGGRARIIGRSITTAPALAALANGTSAHALDFDDRGHFSAHCLAGALAVAEDTGASGADFLRAFVAAREVAHRLSQSIDANRSQGRGPTHRGWYTVGLVSTIASAVAAAMLLELGVERTASAIGIAAANAGGVRRNQGTMAKALSAGGAHDGVRAAFLAQAGFTGDREVLEAPLGLFAALCQPDELDLTPLTNRLGAPFTVEEGTDIKPYPACTPSHAAIAAVLELRSQYGFSSVDIVSIETDLKTWSMFRVAPRDDCEAGFCVPYLLAVAVVAGRVGIEQLSERYRRDREVTDLMARVREPADHDGLVIRLTDGRLLHRPLLSSVIGSAPTLTGASIVEKFRDCVTPSLGERGCHTLLEQLAAIDSVRDVRTLQLAD